MRDVTATATVPQEIYDQIDRDWVRFNLMGRNVYQTPGWKKAEAAVGAFAEFFYNIGYTMGPTSSDVWANPNQFKGWIHIFSHDLVQSGHTLEHAKCERQLQLVVLQALDFVK